ncbi:MAG: orotidine-5'-phosphate decarboxylase [Nitriliruptoraceae bacterium]
MTSSPAHERIAVALDVDTLDEALRLAKQLTGHVGWFKVGLELFGAYGPDAVRRIATFGNVFLDLKLHDIPTTVERAARQVAQLGAGLLTVHAGGGETMMRAACDGFGDAGKVLAVTVLTSLSDTDLHAIGCDGADIQVVRLAALASASGVPGLVCAPRDLTRVRAAVGDTVMLVTPGIRLSGSAVDDHARSASPRDALRDGADLLVVGRPITRAHDPVGVAASIAAELADV